MVRGYIVLLCIFGACVANARLFAVIDHSVYDVDLASGHDNWIFNMSSPNGAYTSLFVPFTSVDASNDGNVIYFQQNCQVKSGERCWARQRTWWQNFTEPPSPPRPCSGLAWEDYLTFMAISEQLDDAHILAGESLCRNFPVCVRALHQLNIGVYTLRGSMDAPSYKASLDMSPFYNCSLPAYPAAPYLSPILTLYDRDMAVVHLVMPPCPTAPAPVNASAVYFRVDASNPYGPKVSKQFLVQNPAFYPFTRMTRPQLDRSTGLLYTLTFNNVYESGYKLSEVELHATDSRGDSDTPLQHWKTVCSNDTLLPELMRAVKESGSTRAGQLSRLVTAFDPETRMYITQYDSLYAPFVNFVGVNVDTCKVVARSLPFGSTANIYALLGAAPYHE